MKFFRNAVLAVFFIWSGLAPTHARADLMDDVNGFATPGFFVFFSAAGFSTDANIGWIYNTDTAYNLDRIETTFRSVPNGSAFSRSVTMSIWDAHPGSGGTRLRSGSFSVGQAGGVHGISFPEFELASGQDYFIGLEDVLGLGINIVEPIGGNFGNGQPIGTEFLNGWYSGTGSSFDTFTPLATGDPNVPNNPFAAPIFRLYGSTIAVPEPTSTLMFIAGLGFLSFARQRRQPGCLAH